GRDRDSERPGQPDVERRSPIERPSRTAVLQLIGYPGLSLRGAVDLIDDVLGTQIVGFADGDQGLEVELLLRGGRGAAVRRSPAGREQRDAVVLLRDRDRDALAAA